MSLTCFYLAFIIYCQKIATQFLSTHPREKNSYVWQMTGMFYNSSKLKTIMQSCECVHQQETGYIKFGMSINGILLSSNKEWIADSYHVILIDTMLSEKEKNPSTEECILYDSIYIEIKNNKMNDDRSQYSGFLWGGRL